VGIDLAVEGAPFVQESLRQGVLINCTHDHILRLLPPFVIGKKDVAEFLDKFGIVLARVAKAAKKSSAGLPRAETRRQPMALAAAR
jgi:acetylornithine/N-succinyldiaminopimelate aminotransferase